MVVDWDGYPVGYEVFDGNVGDHATVSGTLEKLKRRFGICSPTVCMDRGMVTEETLSLLRGGYRWIVTESREKAREYACKADARAWQVIRRDKSGAVLIEVQEIGCEAGERLILVRSAGCAMKEKGIHDRLLGRMRKDLESLAARVDGGKLKVGSKIERAVGRILERYPGMSRWVVVEVLNSDGKALRSVAGEAGVCLGGPGERRCVCAADKPFPRKHGGCLERIYDPYEGGVYLSESEAGASFAPCIPPERRPGGGAHTAVVYSLCAAVVHRAYAPFTRRNPHGTEGSGCALRDRTCHDHNESRRRKKDRPGAHKLSPDRGSRCSRHSRRSLTAQAQS